MLKKMFYMAAFFPVLLWSADIVLDGKAVSEIILGDSPSRAAQFAAYELQYHVRKKTGVELPIVKKSSGKFANQIFVGVSDAALKTNSEFGKFMPQEYAIKVKGNQIFLAGLDDEKDKTTVNYADANTFPSWWEPVGTTYAVYDFLERNGIRWYLPTELGITFMPDRNFSAADMEVQRRPSMEFRHLEWGNMPSDLCGDTVPNPAEKTNLSYRDGYLWYMRQKLGGVKRNFNHSLYLYYTRFPEKKAFFAQGYGDAKAPQLCYTNKELIAQVVKDARDFFDGKVKAGEILTNVGMDFQSDAFPLWPMDNDNFCKCPECRKYLLPEPSRGVGQFSNDSSSNYLFRFVNEVAKELKKTHPDKKIATGAYASFVYPPSDFRLEDNVIVMVCLHTRLVFDAKRQQNDHAIGMSWAKEYPDMTKYVWMYYCFPSLSAVVQHTRYFPLFFAGSVGKYMKNYTEKYGFKGMFLEPSYLTNYQLSVLFDQVEGYINWQLAFNKDLNADELFEQFFRDYYGPAAKPMRDFYCFAEKIATDPANYPANASEQTDDIAWNKIGTVERMEVLKKHMEAAVQSAKASPYKERVALFEKGIWNYMQKGKAKADETIALKSPSMQQSVIPDVANPEPGNPLTVDWSKASRLMLYGDLRANPLTRDLDVRTAHDKDYIYFRYTEHKINPADLASDNLVWHNDEWESFFAKQRSVPYRQLAVDVRGMKNYGGANNKGTLVENWLFPGRIEVKTGSDFWEVLIAVKMSDIVQGGIKEGETLYYNLIRSSKAKAVGCFIPTFSGYHAADRFGELYLIPGKRK